MEANEWFYKNEELLSNMKYFIREIEGLEGYRQIFKLGRQKQTPGNLQRITKQIKRSKERLQLLNDTYDQQAYENADKTTNAFLKQILEYTYEITRCYKKVHNNTWT
jgi:hypothetical protein